MTADGKTLLGRDRKDLLIAALALLVVILGGVIASDRWAGWSWGEEEGVEEVAVFDVVLDREERRWLDIFFDRPLVEEGRSGEVLAMPPATVSPALAGSWRWLEPHALRFEPSGGFAIATEYEIALIPERLLGHTEVELRFGGETTFTVRTDQFLVEKVESYEEPVADKPGAVVLRGEARFNYPVDPDVLIAHIRLLDPARDEPVEVMLETRWNSAVIGWRSAPVVKSKEERRLTLVIDEALTSVAGNVPLSDDARHEILLGSKDRLVVRGVEVAPGEEESVVRVRFSSPVSPALAGKYLKVEPAVDYRLGAERNELLLTGGFRPGSSYELSLAAGLPGRDTAVLAEGYQTRVRLPDLPPAVDFHSQGMFLSASGYRNLALETVNVDRVELKVERVYRNNLFFLFQYQGYRVWSDYAGGAVDFRLGDELERETLKIAGPRNRRVLTTVDVGRYVEGSEPGLYRVAASRPGDWRDAHRWLLITDLGLVAKQGEDEFLVWASSFADLAPVAGARVRLISQQNQVLGQGTTDGGGFWRLGGLRAMAEEGAHPYMVTVERGGDWSFLLLEQSGVDTTGLDVGGAALPPAGYSAYLYGERDLYRPGETVAGVAVARDGSLRPPAPMPAVLLHRDPEGRERGSQLLRLDERGLAEFTLEVPPYALTGHHTLELRVAEEVLGTYAFQVEEFVPDRIKVEIDPPADAVGPGGELAWEVSSHYLFGPPAAGLAVESRARLRKALFTPPGYEGFSFVTGSRHFDDREILSRDGRLSEEGTAAFAVSVPAGLTVPSSLEAVLTARVREQGGRGVAARARVPIHPYPYYLGLRAVDTTAPEPGREKEFEYVAVTPGGEATPAGALVAELYQDRWQTVLRRAASGDFRYESVKEARLLDRRALPAGEGRGRFRFTPPEWGSYRVVISDPAAGPAAETSFYAGGWGYSPWAIQNPGRLELELDKEEYQPGETAVVEIKSPFAGRLLVTVEREGVLHREVHTMSGNSARVTLAVAAAYRPNAYVTATVLRRAADVEPGTAGRAFGAVPLNVDRLSNRLAVEIEAPAEMRPGRRLEVGVRTAPGAAVTLAAVDEGILQLIAQRTPDPFTHFYRQRALGVRSFDIFSLLLPEVAPRGPAGGGEGGAGMAQFLRTEGIRRVEPVAFWSGLLKTGGDGRARAAFDVPEFAGALRLMAVALRGGEFGSAESFTRVRDPLVVLPTAPRFLSFGDTVQLPVTVRNDTPQAGAFRVEARAQGPLTVIAEPVQAELDRGRETTLYFAARAGEHSGDVRLTFTASGNGETTRAGVSLPLGPALPPQTTEITGAVSEPTLSVAFAGPAAGPAGGLLPETARRELRLGPVPVVQFAGKLRYLLRYPYGCLEQTVSAVFPLIYLGELAKRLEPVLLEEDGEDGLEARVRAGTRRLHAMQLQNGGFGMWPGDTTTHPWGSLYAAHFLVEARRAGHLVEESLHEGALNHLASEVKAKTRYGHAELQRAAYALYVLARAGRADLGTMDFLRERQKANLSRESRGLLAAAYALVGNRRAVEELAAGLEDAERVDRQTGGNLDSTVRNRALLLLALLEAAPADPRVPRLVDRLTRDAGAERWWNTQESAFTLIALGQFFQRQAATASYSGSVWVGGEKVGDFGPEMVAFTDIRGTAPVEIRMAKGYREGAAFFSVLTRGVPTAESFRPAAEGLEIERAYLTREGRPADLAAVRQGDLLVIRTRLRSVSGAVENVVVSNLLPAGLEVENPRLASSETLPWVADANLSPAYLDLRDDRLLLFTDLPADQWQTHYALARAVTPGTFQLPPAQAEAMYNPALRATGPRGELRVLTRE